MGIGELYVDNYVNDSGVTDTNCIMLCIDEAIRYGKKAVFTRGKEYLIENPIVISNQTNENNSEKGINSLKPIYIDFNGAIIKAKDETFATAETDSKKKSLIYITAASHNGNVVNYITNFRADATNANYGIYATSSTRLRMENVDITNGKMGAIYLARGIENYVDKFSLWRTESANNENDRDSVGIECHATDSYFSNGVIVNYMISCKSGSGVTWDKCHPWNWYDEGDTNNREVVKAGVGFEVNGQTNITNCEFDSIKICVKSAPLTEVDDDGKVVIVANRVKQPVNIDNCMVIMSTCYNESGAGVPTLIHLESGAGANIHVRNINLSQAYKEQMYFCNNPHNQIQYDLSEKMMLNLPETKVYKGAIGSASGTVLSIECDKLKITNASAYVMISGRNMLEVRNAAAIHNVEKNGISLSVDEATNAITINGTAEADTYYYLIGAWGVSTAVMLFKQGYTYCISRPSIAGVNLNLIGETTVKKVVGGAPYNTYELYTYFDEATPEFECTGVFLSVKKDTCLENFIYYPYIGFAGRPEPYEKGRVQIVSSCGEEITTNGFCHLITKGNAEVSVRYYNDEMAELIKDLETLKNA